MVMKNNPCHNCQSRTLGCHSTCNKYIEAKKRLEIARTQYQKHKEINAYMKIATERVKTSKYRCTNGIFISRKR